MIHPATHPTALATGFNTSDTASAAVPTPAKVP